MKCIVQNCENHSHQGMFIGELCSPCHAYISTGSGKYSQAYRNVEAAIDKEIKMSEEFINSQVEYYRKHLNCGPSRDWDMIHGLHHFFQGLQNARHKKRY